MKSKVEILRELIKEGEDRKAIKMVAKFPRLKPYLEIVRDAWYLIGISTVPPELERLTIKQYACYGVKTKEDLIEKAKEAIIFEYACE
jgi:hypothetical protein